MKTTESAERFVFSGWEIHWTGWKSSIENPQLVGQYYAVRLPYDREAAHLYASSPGGEGFFHGGDRFDIERRETQREIRPSDSAEFKEEERLRCLMRILRLVDEVGR